MPITRICKHCWEVGRRDEPCPHVEELEYALKIMRGADKDNVEMFHKMEKMQKSIDALEKAQGGARISGIRDVATALERELKAEHKFTAKWFIGKLRFIADDWERDAHKIVEGK